MGAHLDHGNGAVFGELDRTFDGQHEDGGVIFNQFLELDGDRMKRLLLRIHSFDELVKPCLE